MVSVAQQPTAPPSKAELAAKQKAGTLQPGDPFRITKAHAPEQFGRFVASNEQSLTFYSILVDQNETVAYADIAKLKQGAGNFNPYTGQRKSHKEAIIITSVAAFIIVSGILAGSFRE